MILVFLGGILGAITRFGISELIHSNIIGTWIVNILGSFLLTFLFLTYSEAIISDSLFTFWGIGFSGAFTTFSTVNNQLFESILQKNYKQALFISSATYLIILLFMLIFHFFLKSFYL